MADLEALKARVSAVPAGEMVAVYAETVRGLIGENERLAASEARAKAAAEMLLVFMAAPPDFTVDQARAAIAALRPAPEAEG
jgi:hypothetical protein